MADRVEGLSLRRLDEIEAKLAEFVAAGELPGVAFQVARHGRVARRATLGWKDIAGDEPLAEDTIYRIFSMTKPVTAVTMLTLFERGIWRLDDPIAKHLPEFADVRGPGGAAVDHAPTMRELMTHTAGFGYAVGFGPHDQTDQAYLAAGIWQADGLADFSHRLAAIPLAYQPGSAWRYSLSMDLQGAIIERLTGQGLPAFMRDVILAPLGMVDTDFFVPEPKLPRLATLYHKYGTDRLTVMDHPRYARDPRVIPALPSGGGGLVTTLDDYARFAQMLLNGGILDDVRILSPQSVALMMTNHLPGAILEAGVVAGAQRIGPGRGYGFNGAVFHDPQLARSTVGRGTYQWDGASGVWFWVDPENELTFIGMIQRMMQPGMPPLQALSQAWIGEALA